MGTVQIKKAGRKQSNRRGASARKLRVAAYCRVSTDNPEQVTSYQSQVKHYAELIKNNDEWELAGIYADEGISGVGTAKRDEFKRMIEDAKRGMIDLILVKNISRFARNTLHTLEYVRMLKGLNISIQFEEENINTMEMSGELLLTVLSSVAQAEVQNLSEHTKMGLQMKMKRGEICGFSGCLGYDWHPDTKTMTVNEREAETVRFIFRRYCEGAGAPTIVKELKQLGYKSRAGGEISRSGVMCIIKNPLYCGDLLSQKTFTLDPISKRKLKNLNDIDQYYTKDHHEAIIPREVFEQAQSILAKRNEIRPDGTLRRRKYSRKYAFSSKIKCAFCGKNYSRRRMYKNKSDNAAMVWECVSYTHDGKQACPYCKAVPEEMLETTFVRSYKGLIDLDEDFIDGFIERVREALEDGESAKELERLDREAEQIRQRKSRLVDLRLDEGIDADGFREKSEELNRQLDQIHLREKEIRETQSKQEDIGKRLAEFRALIANNEPLGEFDRETFETVVDHIEIGREYPDGSTDPRYIKIIYKAGTEDEIVTQDPFLFVDVGYNESQNQAVCADDLQCVADE